MYRVSENGHPSFLSFRLLSGGYDFGMDLVYIKRCLLYTSDAADE